MRVPATTSELKDKYERQSKNGRIVKRSPFAVFEALKECNKEAISISDILFAFSDDRRCFYVEAQRTFVFRKDIAININNVIDNHANWKLKEEEVRFCVVSFLFACSELMKCFVQVLE